MIILKWLWAFVGVGVCARYGSYAAEIVGFHLGWCDMPQIDDVWLFLGMFGATLLTIESTFRSFSKLIDAP